MLEYHDFMLIDRDNANEAAKPTDDDAGHWEALTAPYLAQFADKSPEWWVGFVSGIAKRFDVEIEAMPVVDFGDYGYSASEW